MRSLLRIFIPLTILSIICVLLLSRRDHSESQPIIGQKAEQRVDVITSTQELETRSKRQRAILETNWQQLLEWLNSTPAPSGTEIRAYLLELRSRWSQLDPHVLAHFLEELLEQGHDQSLPLPFEVGLRGFLSGWPDLRVFLVDTLVVADPVESARIARATLATTDSPAEYAVAIRSLIRGSSADATESELTSHFETLLTKPEWQNTAATAEALDLARHLGTPEAASLILRWDGNPGLRQMALHEFAAKHSATLIAGLQAEELLQDQDLSSLMARADPSDPLQASAVDHYLHDRSVSKEHKSRFLSLYPLRSLTTGFRLYSGIPAPYDEAAVRQSDQAASTQVEAWLNDPALNELQPELSKLADQLVEWMEPRIVISWSATMESHSHNPDRWKNRAGLDLSIGKAPLDRLGSFMAHNTICHPLISHELTKLRSKDCPIPEFRDRVRRVARLMAPYATQHMPTEPVDCVTPLEKMQGASLIRQVTLVPILRAGLGLVDGFLDILPESSVAHIGLARNEETLHQEPYYLKHPENLQDKELVVLDPMLATGGSAIHAIQTLREAGARHIRFVCLVASPEGIEALTSFAPDMLIFSAAVD